MAKHRTGYLYKRSVDGKQHPANSRKRGTYYLQYRVNGKTIRQSLKTSNREEAEAKRLEVMAPYFVAGEEEALATTVQRLQSASQRRFEMEDELHPPLAISSAWDTYEGSPSRPQAGEATLRQYGFQWDRFERWMADTHPDRQLVRDVDAPIATAYAKDLTLARYSPNTFNKHVRLLELVFRVVEEEARIERNPWSKISRKRQVSDSRRELTHEELCAVCESADGEMRLLFALGIYTGLRLGDCSTLRWAEVDLRRNHIQRVPNKTASRGKQVSIPLHPALRDMLSEVPRKSRGEYVLPETADMYRQRSDLVTNKVQAHFVQNGLRIHKEGTGGGKKRAVVEVGFHSLRHTFVSLCREANAPLAVVEAIVGHSNPAMTQHYTHVGEEAASAAVAALPSVVGGSIAPEATDVSNVGPIQIVELIKKLNDDELKVLESELGQLGLLESTS